LSPLTTTFNIVGSSEFVTVGVPEIIHSPSDIGFSPIVKPFGKGYSAEASHERM
jgi:hypothetical protein